jgi:hypothetical protein
LRRGGGATGVCVGCAASAVNARRTCQAGLLGCNCPRDAATSKPASERPRQSDGVRVVRLIAAPMKLVALAAAEAAEAADATDAAVAAVAAVVPEADSAPMRSSRARVDKLAALLGTAPAGMLAASRKVGKRSCKRTGARRRERCGETR